jgi:hypothetical protein
VVRVVERWKEHIASNSDIWWSPTIQGAIVARQSWLAGPDEVIVQTPGATV